MIRTRGLTHIALAVRDPERSFRFYQQVFGVVKVYGGDAFVQAQTPGSWDVLVFERNEEAAGGRGGIAHFGFRLVAAEDIELVLDAIGSAGGRILSHGEFCPGEPYVFFEDPDGYVVEVWYELPTPADADSLEIRRGTPADAAALAEFAARTFQEAFGAANRPEHMAAYIAESFGVEQQTRELTDPSCVTLLAYQRGRLAGYAQVRQKTPPPFVTGDAPIELWRFYVDRPWHGHGAAHQLMTEVKGAAKELGGRTIWLSVWEHNPRAISFYKKCGFEDVGTAEFWLGPDRQTDRILVSSR